jgi:hypothetical protein
MIDNISSHLYFFDYYLRYGHGYSNNFHKESKDVISNRCSFSWEPKWKANPIKSYGDPDNLSHDILKFIDENQELSNELIDLFKKVELNLVKERAELLEKYTCIHPLELSQKLIELSIHAVVCRKYSLIYLIVKALYNKRDSNVNVAPLLDLVNGKEKEAANTKRLFWYAPLGNNPSSIRNEAYENLTTIQIDPNSIGLRGDNLTVKFHNHAVRVFEIIEDRFIAFTDLKLSKHKCPLVEIWRRPGFSELKTFNEKASVVSNYKSSSEENINKMESINLTLRRTTLLPPWGVSEIYGLIPYSWFVGIDPFTIPLDWSGNALPSADDYYLWANRL